MSDPANIPFDRGAAEREAKALFPNQALHRAAAAMAGCHPRALDYIRLAPVIVLAANAGKTGSAACRAGRRSGSPMLGLCQRGAKLREVASFFGVALQLRALHANVLHPKRWIVVYRLGRLPPSTLAQIIPSNRTEQDTWLRALTVWAEHCGRRANRDAWLQFAWAASALRTLRRGEEGSAEAVADLAIEAARANPQAGAIFDTRWTFDQAQAAAERWHTALGRLRAETLAANSLGVAFDHAVDYAPFRNETVYVEGFTFTPLRSCEALHLEGRAMRHCVASYSRSVIAGHARIFSVQQAGRRVATLELAPPLRRSTEAIVGMNGTSRFVSVEHPASVASTPPSDWRIAQLKGPCNARPVAGVEAACRAFLATDRERMRAPAPSPTLRSAFPDITARFSDEAAA